MRAGPVSRSTAAHRELLLGRFAKWLMESSPGSTLSQLAREDIPQLSALLEEYGVATYMARWPRQYFVETLNAVASRHGWVRGSLSAPWRLGTTWQMLEPPEVHPPVPLINLNA